MTDITSDAVIGFAKQGHPQAIAVLLNRALVPKGAHVKVRQKKELLKVLINFLRETEVEQLVQLVQGTFNDLSPENIQRVQIFTQRLGDRQASFQKEIVTNTILSASSDSPSERPAELSNTVSKPESSLSKDTLPSSPILPAKETVAQLVPLEPSSDSNSRYSVVEFLSQISSVKDLDVLEDHPFFTGQCPSCSHRYSNLENPPLFWDCPACGWQDDLSQKIPQHQLRETPQRKKMRQCKRLGSYLVESGLLTSAQIEVALADQQLSGTRLGEVLVRRNWIKKETVEYFMQKLVEPERQGAPGQAEAYLESSRNLLKTLIHQSKLSTAEEITQAQASQQKSNQDSSDEQADRDSLKDLQQINTKKTLILSDSEVPPATSDLPPLTAVNERETLLLPDLEIEQMLEPES